MVIQPADKMGMDIFFFFPGCTVCFRTVSDVNEVVGPLQRMVTWKDYMQVLLNLCLTRVCDHQLLRAYWSPVVLNVQLSVHDGAFCATAIQARMSCTNSLNFWSCQLCNSDHSYCGNFTLFGCRKYLYSLYGRSLEMLRRKGGVTTATIFKGVWIFSRATHFQKIVSTL